MKLKVQGGMGVSSSIEVVNFIDMESLLRFFFDVTNQCVVVVQLCPLTQHAITSPTLLSC